MADMNEFKNVRNVQDALRINRRIERENAKKARASQESAKSMTLDERIFDTTKEDNAESRTVEELAIAGNARMSVRSIVYNPSWDTGYSIVATVLKRTADYKITLEGYRQGKVKARETLYLQTNARLNDNGSITMSEPRISHFAPPGGSFTRDGVDKATLALREHIKLELRGKLTKLAAESGKVPMFKLTNNCHVQGMESLAQVDEPKESEIPADESDDSDVTE